MRGQHNHRCGNHPFDAEAVAHALVILRSGVLRGKDARACQPAEDAQVEDEQQLIDDGDRRHLQRTHAPNHHIVQQADDVTHRILNDDGHDHRNHLCIECAIADELMAQSAAPGGALHFLFLRDDRAPLPSVEARRMALYVRLSAVYYIT